MIGVTVARVDRADLVVRVGLGFTVAPVVRVGRAVLVARVASVVLVAIDVRVVRVVRAARVVCECWLLLRCTLLTVAVRIVPFARSSSVVVLLLPFFRSG